MRRGVSTAAVLAVLLASVAVAIALARPWEGDSVAASGQDRAQEQTKRSNGPNVVFIYTDDQDERTFRRRYMPKTFQLLVDKGTRFTEAITATPICCPSRVGYLTGQYPHNNGVFANNPGYEGLQARRNNLAKWMRRSGYETGWIGKFLQGYEEDKDLTQPAPGFSEWAISSPSTYFGYELFEEDRTQTPSGYLTNVLTKKTARIISAQGRNPFFMTVNYLAPHKDEKGQAGPCEVSAEPAPGDLGSRSGIALPRPLSFNEKDISDKRAYVKKQRVEGRRLRRVKVKHQCRVESLAAVDRGVAKIHAAVKRAGELDNTIFVITTDNGLLLGEHRLEGKGIPYEEGLQVPFVMKVPRGLLGSSPVDSSDALVANIDIAPTLLDLAKAKPCISATRCRRLDGKSLVPLLKGRSEGFEDRAILIEGGAHGSECDYRGVRTQDAVLFRRVKRAREGNGCDPASAPELYDLGEDPFQLDNLGVTDPQGSRDLRKDLLERLAELERCSGVQGRDPNGPGPFCG